MFVQYLIRRASQGIIVIFLLLTMLFFTARLTGDPITFLVGGFVTAEDLVRLREAYGLEEPLWKQYAIFMSNALQLDFGLSIRTQEPALSLVTERAATSLKLVVPALVLTIALAIPLGTVAALRRGGFLDGIIMMFAVVGQSVPSFFLGMMLIFIFAVQLSYLPTSGQGDWTHFVLPVIALMGYPMARYTRLVRAQVSETMTHEYVRTARAKGISEPGVVIRHVLKNALLPVVTLLGVEIGLLISGAVIIESVFAWPGFGSLILQAATTRDYPVLQAAGFIVCLSVTVSAIAIDAVYGLLDPRIKA